MDQLLGPGPLELLRVGGCGLELLLLLLPGLRRLRLILLLLGLGGRRLLRRGFLRGLGSRRRLLRRFGRLLGLGRRLSGGRRLLSAAAHG